MAEMTVELRNLLKTDFELFDFDYIFDDKAFKKEIEILFIDHYFFSEIGQETPERFKQRFKSRWCRIIPYYNNLYNTTLLTYNPLVNYTINEGLNQLSTNTNNQETTGTTSTKQDTTGSATNKGKTNSQNDSTNQSDSTGTTTTTDNTQTDTNGITSSKTNDKTSDYPQQPILGGDYLDGEKDSTGSTTNETTSKNTGTTKVDNTSHSEGLTGSVTSSTSEDEGTSTNNLTGSGTSENEIVSHGTSNSEYEKTIEGLTGTTYQELIRKERENLLRIVDMIIEEMKPSFYLIY